MPDVRKPMLSRIETSEVGPSHGNLTIFSAPRSVLRHLEWTLAEVLALPVTIHWQPQPLHPATFCGSLHWSAPKGSAARMASELSGWHYLRYEIFEAPENGTDGSLFMFIPELGIYRGTVGPHGDIVLTEHQLSGLVRDSMRERDLVTKIENALGRPWDEELECYRRAIADGASARLDRVSV